jgi:hypothetical protein
MKCRMREELDCSRKPSDGDPDRGETTNETRMRADKF